VRTSTSCQHTRRRVALDALAICWAGSFTLVALAQERPPHYTEIPVADYASRAKGIIRALYPGLDPPPTMVISDGRDWNDPGEMNVLYVELCDISLAQLDSGEPWQCPNPMLKAHLSFIYWSKDKKLGDIFLTGPLPRGRQDEFEHMMRSHTDWSEAQVIQALEEAGAKYGPDKKQQVIGALPLAELRPYMGELKVESARFDVTDPRDWKQSASLWGGCVWLVPITATARSGNKTHYVFVVEPFGGRVISIWTMLHPTSPDFPGFPPVERPPSGP